MYPIAFKHQALGLLETMNDYEDAAELGVARRTIRNWQSKRSELLAYNGNKRRIKLKPGRRPEVFPGPTGMLEFINGLRDAERALSVRLPRSMWSPGSSVTGVHGSYRTWPTRSRALDRTPSSSFFDAFPLDMDFQDNDLNFILSIVPMGRKACIT
ncbi:hypothetical protein H257_15976 [Aphanomyces astaci]|uniref:HTH psq-type domain-containing protein n=1 Tax=Aphanomyces astaci TaxID=112090 RepID=W4FMI0_APHAT|nr:hypothetical protein H257_15976 [Aphanomyces astaci]ETV68034.1 hypothetical protein H257_15976 [Aphanomyces astaci]|eukprot:XP_009842597.1 hypothetical protein H257_15976 [Aphanomyces astaci]